MLWVLINGRAIYDHEVTPAVSSRSYFKIPVFVKEPWFVKTSHLSPFFMAGYLVLVVSFENRFFYSTDFSGLRTTCTESAA